MTTFVRQIQDILSDWLLRGSHATADDIASTCIYIHSLPVLLMGEQSGGAQEHPFSPKPGTKPYQGTYSNNTSI